MSGERQMASMDFEQHFAVWTHPGQYANDPMTLIIQYERVESIKLVTFKETNFERYKIVVTMIDRAHQRDLVGVHYQPLESLRAIYDELRERVIQAHHWTSRH